MWWKSVPGRKITLPAGLACEQTPLPSGEIGNGGLVTVNHRRPFSDFSCAGGGGGGGGGEGEFVHRLCRVIFSERL